MEDQNVDQLYNEIMGGEGPTQSREAAAGGDVGAPPAQEVVAPEVQQAQEDYELTVNGRKIKANKDQVLKWAQMGYGAPDQIGKLNKQLEAMKADAERYKSYDETYKPIDEWARQNPEKWKELFYSWQTGKQNTQFAQLPPEIIEKLETTQEIAKQLMTERQVQEEKQADEALGGEIEGIRKAYPQFDFDKVVDESGLTLEQKVLDHALKNGIGKFTTAFRDYYHDQLVKVAEEKGKTSLNNNLQKQAREGFIGKAPTSSKQITTPQNLKSKSYSDLANEAIEELRQMGAV